MSKDGIATRKQTMCSATRQGAYFSVRIRRWKTTWVVEKLLDALPLPVDVLHTKVKFGGTVDISVIAAGSAVAATARHQRENHQRPRWLYQQIRDTGGGTLNARAIKRGRWDRGRRDAHSGVPE